MLTLNLDVVLKYLNLHSITLPPKVNLEVFTIPCCSDISISFAQ